MKLVEVQEAARILEEIEHIEEAEKAVAKSELAPSDTVGIIAFDGDTGIYNENVDISVEEFQLWLALLKKKKKERLLKLGVE